MRWRSLGLAVVVPALVVGAVALTAGAAVFVALYFGRVALLAQELLQMGREAETYAASVRFYLDGARSVIETTAALPPVRDSLAAAKERGPATPAELLADARLRAALVVAHSGAFADVALIGLDGRVILLEPERLERTQARPDRGFNAWFREAITSGRTVISDLQLSPATLEPTVVIASPVRDRAGRPMGVWAGSLRLAELSRVGRAGDLVGSAYGFVTDRRGWVVAHQVAAHYVQYQTDLSAAPPVQAALRGQRGAGQVRNAIERVDELSAWVPLPEIGWAVVYQEPVQAAAAPIRAFGWSIVPFAGGIAAALGVVGLVLARRIVRPIQELTRAAERIGSGAPRFQVDTSAGAEVGQLATALNRMVGALGEKDAALRERAQALERAVADLEAADRSKDEFLATLSHELRTPLNAVYGWARMLRTRPLDAAMTARALESIERNAAAQTHLISDLLDVSRIVTGKMRLSVEPVAFDDVIRTSLDTVRVAADAKGVRLVAVLDPQAGRIMGDPERLQQIVWNLLVNAVKFTPRGGRVLVQLRRVESHVELTVQDTGQGIAADVLPHLFERFRQADSSSTRVHGGLGIGLALVRHLVELHGGAVRAESEGESRGATFVVELPLAAVGPLAADVEAASAIAGATPAGRRLAGISVLIVDDDPDGAELMATVLSQGGATVRTCASAGDAVEQFQASRPDVLLADIEMPGRDGYSLIRQIRALPAARGGNVPAAAITAYGRTEDRVRALSAGFTMHLPKPIDPVELSAAVLSLARQGA